MGKILVIAEKPSVGRELARVLKCNKKENGCLIGSKYIVTWALGHLVTLAEPEVYNKRYKTWKMEDLPMLPKNMELVVMKQTAKQFNVVKGLMRRKNVNELVIATDAGREGELVARWIIEKVGWNKPIKRLWISSQTERAIKEGFQNLKPGKQYERLYMSAQCRAEADWLIGLNVTRALTCKYNAQLSAGRVQTPTLAMIVEREDEIKKFVPKDYWTIVGSVKGFSIYWKDSHTQQMRIFNKEKAEQIAEKTNGKLGKVIDIRKTAKKELPPLAYDLTELQRDANRRYGFSAKNTLSILQRLYETHKLVTYPRTDSRYISTDIVPTLPERLKSIAVGPYKSMTQEVLKHPVRPTKRFVDNSRVTDHHAIIPTEQYVSLSDLNREERQIYDLIVKRFIILFKPPFKYEQTNVTIEVQGEKFYAKGKIVTSKGWKSVYDEEYDNYDNQEEEERDQSLPEIHKGEGIKILSIKVKDGKTKPPARYTEATLLSAMEHPERFVKSQSLKKALEDSGGLGTPATRADIIEKLFNTFYVEKRGKEIYPTSKGIQLIKLVPEDLKSPALTAKWEQQLFNISKGTADGRAFIIDMKNYASKLVSGIVSGTAVFHHDNITGNKCPECGQNLLEVKGKKGKMLVCRDRSCGYRQRTSQFTQVRCTECHKRMELHGEGEGRIFICPCGFREKLSAYNKRKENRKGKVNKRETQKFLKQQKPDETINSALADALKQWETQKKK